MGSTSTERSTQRRIRFGKSLNINSSADKSTIKQSNNITCEEKSSPERRRKSKVPNSKKVRFLKPLPPIPPPNSFAGTQWRRITDPSGKGYGPLDRVKSGWEVEHLLRVRKERMREARKTGNGTEVERLETLDVFDSVCGEDGGSDGSQAVTAASELSSMSETVVDQSAIEGEDVFLQLALGSQQVQKSARVRKSSSKLGNGRCTYPRCPGGEACGGFVRGRGCCLPQPPPSITAAKKQIEYFEQSPIVLQLKQDLKLIEEHLAGLYEPGHPEIETIEQRIETACMSVIVKQFESDVAFVEVYELEMEGRCSRGVWWDKWLVVEDLKRGDITWSINDAKEGL